MLVNTGNTSSLTLVNSGTPPSPALVTVRARIHYLNLAVLAVIAWFDIRSPQAAPGRPLAEERSQEWPGGGIVPLAHYPLQVHRTQDGMHHSNPVDIGFHYAVLRNRAELDSDPNGRPGSGKDRDGAGLQTTGETHRSQADSDDDGVLDEEEVAAFTNPLDKNSWIPKRLAAWWWDATDSSWRLGDRGQSPIATGTETQVAGATHSGVQIIASPSGPLRYDVKDALGRLNLRLDQGSIRLWFKPNWSLPAPSDWSAPLVEVGKYNDTTLGWWSWYLHFDANGEFWVKFSQGANGQFPLHRFQSRLRLSDWGSPAKWHELVLSYDTNATRLFHNGRLNKWTDANGVEWDRGPGVLPTLMPTEAGLAHGIHFGADHSGNQAVNGTFDSIETFNYPLGAVEIFRHQQLALNIVTNAGQRQLQFTRSFEGAPTHSGFLYPTNPDPWPLTLWRRTPGTTNWGAAILSNSKVESWIDAAVSPGTRNEYLAEFASPWGASRRHFVAGIEMPPQHQRGNVLLLVDQTLAPSLSTELAQLRTNLVGDGWTVKHWYDAPRHNDLNFAANRSNLTNVVNWIAAHHVADVANVLLIIGHVTIPYSGITPDDGHGSGHPPDHRGAWVCDAYYGYLDKSPWTDVTNAPGNAPNDGKFDLNVLPGPVDLPVGRVDFARMTVFAGRTEAQLIQRYLEKDFRYRAHGVPTFGRVSYFASNNPEFALRSAQGLSGAAFGLAPGTVFSGANLRHPVPADLGVHFGNASLPDLSVLDDQWVGFDSVHFGDPTKEVPVTFRHVWFSWACDWARLDPSNNAFTIDNNWLRASLGWPNYGLATVGGRAWDFSPLGGGAPLADLMKLGWDGVPPLPRFQSILGDPTLRLHRVTPPQELTATRTGATTTLSWQPSPDPGCHYYVYRSTRGLSESPALLNPDLPLLDLSYTDTGSSAGALYQVRACRLQTTGSGSYWNLSQGVFVAVP